jgi:hypothetical protein
LIFIAYNLEYEKVIFFLHFGTEGVYIYKYMSIYQFYINLYLVGRWEVLGYNQSGVEYSPFPIPMDGLPTRFFRDQ